jgi:iron(III) transport system substrate-binding protein
MAAAPCGRYRMKERKMLKHKRGLVGLVAAIGITSLLAACGSSSDGAAQAAGDSYAKYAAMSGQQRVDALVEAAKKEGSLSVYTTNETLEKGMVAAFKAKYGIKVTVFRGTTEDLRTRILQETGAKRIQNDVVETKDSEMAILDQKGLITPYKSDIADAVPAEAKTDNMVAGYYIATLPIHNTDLVSKGDLPTDISGYADAKWKGKVAVDAGDFNWYQDLHKYYTKDKKMSDDDFVTMMKSVAKNFRVVNGHVANTQLLQAGDFPVFLTDFLHYVPREGGSISYSPVMEPVTLQLLGVNPMNGAAHPAAALLFVDFYLTEGQKYLDDAGFIPANPSQISGYKPRLPKDTTFVTDDWKTLSSESNPWPQAWDNLLKGKDPVLPS